MATEKSAAVLTIKRAQHMTPKGRRELALWLRRQAALLVNHGDELSHRYQARYLYLTDDP